MLRNLLTIYVRKRMARLDHCSDGHETSIEYIVCPLDQFTDKTERRSLLTYDARRHIFSEYLARHSQALLRLISI